MKKKANKHEQNQYVCLSHFCCWKINATPAPSIANEIITGTQFLMMANSESKSAYLRDHDLNQENNT